VGRAQRQHDGSSATPAAPAPATFTGSVSARLLASRVGGRAGRPVEVDRTWFDTFDWRLWRQALALEVDQAPTFRTATLRSTSDHRVQWVQRGREVPAAGELPPGPWRRSLAGLLGLRALVPMASERVCVAEVSCRDGEGKTVATLLWEQVAPSTPAEHENGAGRPTRVRLVPARGYDREARALATRLVDHVGLAPAPGHPLEGAAGGGRRPGDDPGKVRLALRPGMRADDAVRHMLSTLLAVMGLNEPWLGRAPDTEFLHDYRVALRRSRSVLKQARGVLPQAALDEWRPALRDLQVRTNGHRDLDVFVVEFDSYLAAVPEVAASDLEPLRDLLLRHRSDEHADLVRYLDSDEHRSLLARYRAFLEGRPGAGSSEPDAALPVEEVAAARIRRAHRRLLRPGAAIDDASPPAALHELRIAGKELRYLLELYGSLYDPAVLAGVVRELKQLQDNLGEFQDCEIHAQRLHGFAEELRSSPDVATSVLMAVALVAGVFTDRQAAARSAFAGRFAAFSDRGNVRVLERMVTGPAGRS
jgi:CHAD domain-containing protein